MSYEAASCSISFLRTIKFFDELEQLSSSVVMVLRAGASPDVRDSPPCILLAAAA
jgi:hypothetical protein